MTEALDLSRYAEFLEHLRPYYIRWEGILKDALRKWKERGGQPVRIFVFGSILRGEAVPPSSDIDVLLVIEGMDPRGFRRHWQDFFGELHPLHPFEFHFADPETFENWYLRLLGNEYREIEDP